MLEVVSIDWDTREVFFMACGIVAEHDPYYRHLCKVSFNGTGHEVVVLTRDGDGTHQALLSPDRRMFVDTCSRVDLPPIVCVRSCSGARLLDLERADDSALRKQGWVAPERFCTLGRDGETW